MASVKWEVGVDTTVMSTELNSLADNAQAIASSAYDNSSGLYLFAQKLSGSGFEDGDNSIAPPAANLVGVFNIRSSTAAQCHILRQIPICPDQYKWLVINKTGGAMPSSGNTLRQKPLRYQTA